ncbi:MAG: hypothetical protein WC284_15975, partial [Candidimonas sp.]
MSKNKGIIIFAHNTKSFDYYGMAVLTAMHVEKFLSVPVSLITDRWTKEYGEKKYDYDFDNII